MKMIASIPSLPVIDIEKAVKFYTEQLGFSCPYNNKGFAKLKRDAVEIHLWAACDMRWKLRSIFLFLRPIYSGAETFLTGTASCRIQVELIDELFKEYKEKEVLYNKNTVVEKTSWGTLEFPTLDLHRNLITFFQRI